MEIFVQCGIIPDKVPHPEQTPEEIPVIGVMKSVGKDESMTSLIKLPDVGQYGDQVNHRLHQIIGEKHPSSGENIKINKAHPT